MADERLVLGIALDETNCSAEVRRIDTGELLDRVTVPVQADPGTWASAAFDTLQALTASPKRVVSALSGVAPAQTAVLLDAGDTVLGAPLRASDPSTVPDAGWLSSRMDAAQWSAAVGSLPHHRWTLSAMSLIHRSDPDRWSATTRVATPAEYLSWQLSGVFATEPGDASATGCRSADGRTPAWDVLAIVDAERDWSTVLAPSHDTVDVIGSRESIPVVVGTNDIAAAVLVADPAIGDVVVLGGPDPAVIVVLDPAAETPELLTVSDGLGRRLGVVHHEIDPGRGLPGGVIPDAATTRGRVIWVGDGGSPGTTTWEHSSLSLAAAGAARAAAGLLGDTPTTVVRRWTAASARS